MLIANIAFSQTSIKTPTYDVNGKQNGWAIAKELVVELLNQS